MKIEEKYKYVSFGVDFICEICSQSSQNINLRSNAKFTAILLHILKISFC